MPGSRMKFVEPFTSHVFNRFARRFAGRMPGFAIVRYRGRRSGRAYRTPVNVFRDGDDYLFALTYGSDAQWVQNVLAAGQAELEVGGTTVGVRDSRIFIDPSRRLMPLPVRVILRLVGVEEFLRMSPSRREVAGTTA